MTGNAALRVAIDAGPLHGPRTGIGNAVAWTIEALGDRTDIELLPYVLSTRASITPPERRLPIPAMAAHRLWTRRSPRVDRLLRRPDIVHGTNYVVPPTACPRLVSVYDCWFLDRPDDVHPDVARAAKVLRRSVDDGAHVVTSSDATTERVRDHFDTDRVTTVHLGRPPTPPTPAVGGPWPEPLRRFDDGAPYVLSLGTTERRKNVPTLVAAFARLAAEHPTVHLVVAGANGNDHDAVRAAIDRLSNDIGERITVLGPVDAELKGRLLLNASVLAYPSLDEGFGFPILEAHDMEVPVVASTAGSIPEIAGPAALFSAADDVDAIAANLHLALTSDTVRDKLIAQGRTNLGRFSWERTADRLVTLYTRLTNGAAR